MANLIQLQLRTEVEFVSKETMKQWIWIYETNISKFTAERLCENDWNMGEWKLHFKKSIVRSFAFWFSGAKNYKVQLH